MGSLACLGAARSPARWAREGLGAPQATFAWDASCSLVPPPPAFIFLSKRPKLIFKTC